MSPGRSVAGVWAQVPRTQRFSRMCPQAANPTREPVNRSDAASDAGRSTHCEPRKNISVSSAEAVGRLLFTREGTMPHPLKGLDGPGRLGELDRFSRLFPPGSMVPYATARLRRRSLVGEYSNTSFAQTCVLVLPLYKATYDSLVQSNTRRFCRRGPFSYVTVSRFAIR